jgi:ribonuclease HII
MPPRKVKTTLALRCKADNIVEAGIDEAGRGCFWGPLVAGSVIWPPENEWTDEHHKIAPQIQDSKTISKKKRASLSEAIKRLAVSTGVGIVSAKEVDSLGITQANQEAFVRALGSLKAPWGRVLIDGILDCVVSDDKEIETVIDGDAKLLSIAAASIIAKVAHDEFVSAWCQAHSAEAEKYDLMSCMGYGTLRHRNAIKEYGLLEDHRRLFMKKTLPTTTSDCLVQEED